jgi:hypothetical protein
MFQPIDEKIEDLKVEIRMQRLQVEEARSYESTREFRRQVVIFARLQSELKRLRNLEVQARTYQ